MPTERNLWSLRAKATTLFIHHWTSKPNPCLMIFTVWIFPCRLGGRKLVKSRFSHFQHLCRCTFLLEFKKLVSNGISIHHLEFILPERIMFVNCYVSFVSSMSYRVSTSCQVIPFHLLRGIFYFSHIRPVMIGNLFPCYVYYMWSTVHTCPSGQFNNPEAHNSW